MGDHVPHKNCSRALCILVVFLGTVVVAEAADPHSVALLTGSGITWRAARQIVERFGGHVAVVASPDVLIGVIPDGAEAALREASISTAGPAASAASGGFRVIRTRADAESLLGPPNIAAQSSGTLSNEARAALRLLSLEVQPLGRDSRYRVLSDGTVEVRPMSDVEDPPLLPPFPVPADPRLANALGNTFNNSTGFLAGDIAVGILRPESTGVADGMNTENWTDTEVANSLTEILASLDKLTSDSPRGKVTFVVRTENSGTGVAGTVATDYEAILYSNWTSSVVLNFLGKLGYTQANFFTRLREWDNDIRSDLGTDWAFGIIVVDNSTDTSRGRASAYLNGPGEWLFQSNSASVYHHESGHVFGAQDEYHPDAAKSPTGLWGYMQVPNANSQYNDGNGFFSGAGEGIPALQLDSVNYVSPWSRGAWGIWDLDGDGINDIQDTFPTVTLGAPSGTSSLTFTGTASSTPMKRQTGTYVDADVTINRIDLVEWRINGSAWQNATASDGAFNSSSENFTFATPLLRNGPYVVESRARDNFGNVTANYPRQSVTASGSGATNNVPMPALNVAPNLGSVATLFQLSAVGSIDAEDSLNLLYRWDYENDGTYDTSLSANPVTTHTYASAGSQTARLEVRDGSGAVATRTVTFTVAATNVPPSATFNVDKGALFAASPAVFNFDAAGVGDGEDAVSSLQIRWDFEDDGIWDTGFASTKTVSHDYAQALPVTVSNEVSTTYLYSGNTVDGFSQSFVATSTGVGQAELMLKHNNDNTAGGTCTVGIRSALTAAFLTSITKDQVGLKEGDWNLFDFPDISMTNGGIYYLVMICSDADMMWAATSADPYPGGQHHYSFDAGASWNTDASDDHAFHIYDSVVTAVPLTKSRAWRVRMEVKDSNGQTAQTVRDIWTNSYDTPPTVSLVSSILSGTTGTTYALTATGADTDSATLWDGLLQYRWDVDGDGNFETEFAAASTRNATYAQAGTYQATVEVRDRYYARARASVLLSVAPASGATQITKAAGDNQTASIGSPVSTAPSVVVRDASNQPVAGVTVVFSVVSGGGILSGATQTTNISGIATLGGWTLGSQPGANSLAAKMPHFPQASALTFSATASNVQTLTISRAGSGNGTVTSSPAGISCGSTCSFDFADGATVTLTAASDPVSTFAGWSGAGCSGIGTCQVTMNAARTVTATFNLQKKVRGQITSN